LTDVKKIISQYISRLEHVDIPLPKIWVRVRFTLENDSRNYISLEQYYKLCQTNGLSNRKDMLQLSGYLHDLGVCLHFQDDSTLKHWVILKPQWGTTAVYKVLDNTDVKQNLGRFTNNDLATIWDDNQYANMRDESLELMIRFKLCYRIPHHPHNYIAPQLLELVVLTSLGFELFVSGDPCKTRAAKRLAQGTSDKGDLSPHHLDTFVVTIGSDNFSTRALSRTTTLPMHGDRSFPFDSE
jgi:hypothetical protein